MFIFVCAIVGAIIFGILFYKDRDEDTVWESCLGLWLERFPVLL